jgi:DNA adenine methylase
MLTVHPEALSPLVKWAGGKRRLVSKILEVAPSKFATYYEPFLGGGAVFFSILPKRAVLGDANRELVGMYLQIRDCPDQVIRFLSRLRNTEQDYYRIRSMRAKTKASQAARLVYLCTLSFNGIYRQNLDGEFNVPYGNKDHLNPCDKESITEISRSLKGRTLVEGDFEDTVGRAKRGDFVYFDPPYTVAHGNNGFVKYNAHIFSWDDQMRLARVASRLKRTGCNVVVSNADHPSIRKLYSDFNVRIIKRHSVMAASTEFRRPVRECLFY